jgi:hypothetical protein
MLASLIVPYGTNAVPAGIAVGGLSYPLIFVSAVCAKPARVAKVIPGFGAGGFDPVGPHHCQ